MGMSKLKIKMNQLLERLLEAVEGLVNALNQRSNAKEKERKTYQQLLMNIKSINYCRAEGKTFKLRSEQNWQQWILDRQRQRKITTVDQSSHWKRLRLARDQ